MPQDGAREYGHLELTYRCDAQLGENHMFKPVVMELSGSEIG